MSVTIVTGHTVEVRLVLHHATDTPVSFDFEPFAVGVATGTENTYFVADDGAVYSSGDSLALGDGQSSRNDPMPFDGLSDVEEVAAGNPFACARTPDGEVSCWGSNPALLPGVDAVAAVNAGRQACTLTRPRQAALNGSTTRTAQEPVDG